MATISDFTFRFYDENGNPADFTPAQTTQIIKLLPGLIPDKVVHGSKELYDHLCTQIAGGVEGDSVYFVTVEKLVSSYESVTQRDLQVANVAKVLLGDYGLLKGHPLYRPLLLGKMEDGRITNDGGRHRLAAVISLFKGMGFSDELVNKVELPAFLTKHNPVRIITDNTSRGVLTFEKAGINATMVNADLDISDPKEIWKAYMGGTLPGSPVTQRGTAMRLAFIANTEGTPLADDLTPETRGKIAASLASAFNKRFAQYSYAVKDPAFLIKLMGFTADVLPAIITQLHGMGVTNLARNTATIVSAIMVKLEEAIKAKKIEIPVKPQVVKAKTAESEVKPKTKTKKAKKEPAVEAAA